MPFRNSAIWLYRQMTARSRRRLLEQLRESNQLPVGVLFYHRVADTELTPWTISTADFKRQLDWLQDNFDLVSLEESQRRIRSQSNDRFTVSITFDDGYAENAQHAIPELIARKIPATYFTTTDFITGQQRFPHDVEVGCSAQPNTWEELREFVRCGIEVGAHSRSHCDIGTIHDIQRLTDELIGSIQILESELNTRCRYFAFPFGKPANISQAAVSLLRQYGIEGFCSAYGALNWPGNDGFHIRRFHGDPLLERLKNWLTLDKRHMVDYHELQFDEPTYVVPDII
jgi:peptidoglycan/xylan/chitin deacetylase (PgdA/CDA1 family)